ncbi:hypothetical protein ABDB91_03235 [Desulfoscipio sp. XC116]
MVEVLFAPAGVEEVLRRKITKDTAMWYNLHKKGSGRSITEENN